MEVFSVGVQVPPLAPPRSCTHRGSGIALAAIAAAWALASCAPDPLEARAAIEAALTDSPAEPLPAFLDLLTPESRPVALAIAREKGWTEFRRALLADLKNAESDRGGGLGPNLVLRPKGSQAGNGVLLVRDGGSWRLDLSLTQATFAPLRDGAYPAP